MQLKDPHIFAGGLNTDDAPGFLPPGDYTLARNVRTLSSSEQHGQGPAETLQAEIPVLLGVRATITYYGGEAIGGDFVYSGYEEVVLGSQTWMKKNWQANYPGSKVYNNNENNRNVYGGLYTQNQVRASDFCPEGWHVPTEAEADELLTFLGGAAIAGGVLKEYGDAHWTDPNAGASDSAGFRALPGGKFDAAFDLLGDMGLLWLADDAPPLPPTLLNASNIDFNKFNANFKASDGADGYLLDVSTVADFSSFLLGYVNKDIGNVLFSEVTGLSPDTNYYFRLRAYNDIGISDYSETGTLRTLSALVDMDGNVYRVLTIGTQQWLIEALRTTKYTNGDAIPNITDNDEWVNGKATDITAETFGALYNWWARTDVRNITSEGWRVPSHNDYLELAIFCNYSSNKLRTIGTDYWISPNTGATNEYNFNAKGTGWRTANDGSFAAQYVKLMIGLSDDILDADPVAGFQIYSTGNTFTQFYSGNPGVVGSGLIGKRLGLTCRLVKETTTLSHGETGIYIGNDDKQYSTICIGTQEWIVDNLNETKYRNGDLITVFSGTNANWIALNSEAMCYYPADPVIEYTLDGAYCWYNNDISNKNPYGALYNQLAVKHINSLVVGQFSIGGVVDTGWKVPSKSDWQVLIDYLGGAAITGGKLKEKGILHWTSPNVGAGDDVGFAAVGGGWRSRNDGSFGSIDDVMVAWTKTYAGIADQYYAVEIHNSGMIIYTGVNDQKSGYSVRCMRDLTTLGRYVEIIESPLTKGDGKFRVGVRNHQLVTDQALTDLGFNGNEGEDWINIKALP